MKKAKIMLAGLVIIAAVGSGLAFKAQKYSFTIWTGATTNVCATPADGFTTALSGSVKTYVTTVDGGDQCEYTFTAANF